MVFHSCRYCGLSLSGSAKKRFCSDSHKMKYHRIIKKGFEMVMVERKESDLKQRLIKMRYDGNEEHFFILKKEHGDSLSKDCWYIFLKGKLLKDWKRVKMPEIDWAGSAEEQPARHDR